MQRVVTRSARVVAAATMGICGIALSAALSTGDDTTIRSQAVLPAAQSQNDAKAVEAPTGLVEDPPSANGFESDQAFEADRKVFQEVEAISDGLGPVYNATSCVGCHQNPITGGSTQLAEIRAGKHTFDPNDPSPRKVRFEEPPGGSVIQQRAIDPAIQDRVLPEFDVRALRMSNTVLGNGFIEVLTDDQITSLRNEQRKWHMEGFAVVVPVPVAATKIGENMIKATFQERVGRFGWKCQEASLLNFSAGAYVVEMGITNPLNPTESMPNGRDVSMFDKVPDPEDHFIGDEDPTKTEHLFGFDVESFTRFMRSTKAFPRDPDLVNTPDAIAGEALFRNNKLLGCAICHQPDYTTPPAGSPILTLDKKRGSDMETVPAALGDKVFHPYSDFMLHDVGTGDGIAQTQHANLPAKDQSTVEKISEKTRTEYRLGRVDSSAEKDNRRMLKPTDPPVNDLDQRTSNKMRTAPLWGLRSRPQLMHDGMSLTVEDAILRHAGQAEGVRLKYEALSSDQKRQLDVFLKSL